MKIEAKVKGKGTAGVAVYLYDAKGYIFSGNLAKVTATDVFTEVEGKHVVRNEYEITRNGVKVKQCRRESESFSLPERIPILHLKMSKRKLMPPNNF